LSQVKTLPITATRWLSLLLCAITAATITVFLSKVGFVQKTYSSWCAILNANPVLHYSSAFLAGIGIKLLLDKFYISHTKRSIEFIWRYPPVTIAVLASYFLTAFYMLSTAPKFDEAALYAQSFMSLKYLALTFIGMLITVIYQAKLYTQKPIFTAVLVALSTMYVGFAVGLAYIAAAFYVFISLAASYLILAIYLLCNEHRQSKQQNFTSEIEPIETKESPELKTLEDFREWFKDDSTIKSTERLEPDLQVYVKRITERLQNGGDKYEKNLAQHIALCGPYGCGKSSIVESIVNDLAKNSAKDSTWIHSDISTWGAASGSVAHVVLSHIIDDISQYIDMCAFRALPKHYTEALKSGGSVFQFASTLLAGPVDIEGSFQKLNDVLDATNHKLLITLQDVDRGTGDENEKRLNDIAALLDRLKNRKLGHISFIIAMGNESDAAAEVISKATDYREDILISNISGKLKQFIFLSINKAVLNGVITLYSSGYGNTKNSKPPFVYLIKDKSWIEDYNKFPDAFFEREVIALTGIIYSVRLLKKIIRRVDAAWNKSEINGEVNLLATIMLVALKESKIRNYALYLNQLDEIRLNSQSDLTYVIEAMSKREDGSVDLNIINYFDALLNVKVVSSYYASEDEEFNKGNKASTRKLLDPISVSTQSIGRSDTEYSNFLSLIELEKLPKNWLKQQPVLKCLYIEDNASAGTFAKNWLKSHNIRELTSELIYCPSYKANLRNIFSSILKQFANINIKERNALRRTKFLYNLGDIFLATTDFNSFSSDSCDLINVLEGDLSSQLFSYCFSKRLLGDDGVEVKFEENDVKHMIPLVTRLSFINGEEAATLIWPLYYKLGKASLKNEVKERIEDNASSYLVPQQFSNVIDPNTAYNLYADFHTINIDARHYKNFLDIPESVLDEILRGVQYD
tara:strand:+ start:278 stop:3034 length:2757 start_codon:yes stop_codon:yes gene_type:complete